MAAPDTGIPPAAPCLLRPACDILDGRTAGARIGDFPGFGKTLAMMSKQPESLPPRCPICGKPIRPGENILLVDGVETHVDCVQDEPPEAA